MISRGCGINIRTQNIIGYIIVLTGLFLLISGLCILVISVLRQ
jgi:hypothetical protein